MKIIKRKGVKVAYILYPSEHAKEIKIYCSESYHQSDFLKN